jgi:hypothetical protein
MSLTEQTCARQLLEGTYSVLVKPVALFAMVSLLGGPITAPPKLNVQKPCYEAIEFSSSSFSVCKITAWEAIERPGYRPKTLLGKRLMTLRNQAIAKGLTLLDSDEIIEEVSRRRGEVA